MDLKDKIVKSGQLILELYWRWLDEGKYEDINEYGKVISNALGCPVEMTKRPFGFKINGMQIKVTGGCQKAKIELYKLPQSLRLEGRREKCKYH